MTEADMVKDETLEENGNSKHDEELLDEECMDEGGEENEGGEEPAFSIDELYARHGGDPKKLDLSRSVLVSNLPSEFLNDAYEVFNEVLLDMISSDFKIPRENIDAVIRIPKLQHDADDQENALCALISLKSKVHKHRLIAQKKVDDKSSLNLSTLEEIPKDWFDVELFALSDEVAEEGEEEHDKHHDDEKAVKASKKERTKEEIEAEKQREKDEREAFIKRYVDDDDDDMAFTTDWDGAPEFQWKICTTKHDHRRVILDNVFFSDIKDPFLYRAIVRAESVDLDFPYRYNSDGTKHQKGKITITFSRDIYVMPVAMRSLIYIRSQNKRRIKIYLPQHEVTLKMKDEFEKRLGRVIEYPLHMKQLVVKVLPADFTPTVEKAIEWFPGCNVSSVEKHDDGRGQPIALITFESARDAMDAHAACPFVAIEEHKCNVFLMSIEVNKLYLSSFDKQEEKDAYRVKLDKKHEAERAEREKERKRRIESSFAGSSEKKGRWEAPASRGSFRGSRGPYRGSSFRGSLRGRGAPRGSFRGSSSYRGSRGVTPSARTVGRVDPRYSDRPAPFETRREEPLREQLYRQQQVIDSLSDRLRDPPLSRSAFDLRSSSSSAFGSGSSYGGSSGFSSSAFGGSSYGTERSGGYSSSTSSRGSGDYYGSEKRRSYGY